MYIILFIREDCNDWSWLRLSLPHPLPVGGLPGPHALLLAQSFHKKLLYHNHSFRFHFFAKLCKATYC